MSLALLGTTTAAAVVESCGLQLQASEELRSDAGVVGRFDQYSGAGAVSAAVLVVLDTGEMSAEMFCAFTAPDSAVPHLSLDVIVTPAQSAMHLDLLPKVDLATHPSYVEHCFEPLTASLNELAAVPGVVPTVLPPRQLACMSRWAITCTTPPAADGCLTSAAAAYRQHWLSLVSGLPAEVQRECDDADLVERDSRYRQVLFSRTLDPVWSVLTGLVGEPASERVRRSLSGEPQARS